MLRSGLSAAFLLVLAACGDPDTDDPRGYTKAPLENPGWSVDGEEASEMTEHGAPIRVPSMDTVAADTADAPAATAPPGQAAPAAGTPRQGAAVPR